MTNERSARGKWVKISMAASMAAAMMGSTGAAFASTQSTSTQENATLATLSQQLVAMHTILLSMPTLPGQSQTPDQSVQAAERALHSASTADWDQILWGPSGVPSGLTTSVGSTTLNDFIGAISNLTSTASFAGFSSDLNSSGDLTTTSADVTNLLADFAKLHQDDTSIDAVTGPDLFGFFEAFKASIESQVTNLGTPIARSTVIANAIDAGVAATPDIKSVLDAFDITNYGAVEEAALAKFDPSKAATDALTAAAAMSVFQPQQSVMHVGDKATYSLQFSSDISSLANVTIDSSAVTWKITSGNSVATLTDGAQKGTATITADQAGNATVTATLDGILVYAGNLTVLAAPATSAPDYSAYKNSSVVYTTTVDPSIQTVDIQNQPLASGGNISLHIVKGAFSNVTPGQTVTVGIEAATSPSQLASLTSSITGLGSDEKAANVIGISFTKSDGTPATLNGVVTVTISGLSVPTDASIYKLTSAGMTQLTSGITIEPNGDVQISFSSDPYFVIAEPVNSGGTIPPANPGGSTSTSTGTTTSTGTGTSTGTSTGTTGTGTGTSTGGTTTPKTPSKTNPLSKYPDATGVSGGLVNRMEDISYLADKGTIDMKGGTIQTKLKDGTEIALKVPYDAFAVPVEAAISSDASPILVNMDFAKDLSGSTSLNAIGVFFINAKTGAVVEPAIPVSLTVTNSNIPADGVVYRVSDSQFTKDAKAKVSIGAATISVTTGGYVVVASAPAKKGSTTPSKPSKPSTPKSTKASAPTYLWLSDNGKHAAKAPRKVIHKQVYVPVWYVEHALKKLGFTAKYEAKKHMLTLTSPKTLKAHFAKVEIGKGTVRIYVDGKLVKRSPNAIQKDPYSGHMTTWMPMIPVEQALNNVHVKSEVKGQTWNFVTPAKKKK